MTVESLRKEAVDDGFVEWFRANHKNEELYDDEMILTEYVDNRMNDLGPYEIGSYYSVKGNPVTF